MFTVHLNDGAFKMTLSSVWMGIPVLILLSLYPFTLYPSGSRALMGEGALKKPDSIVYHTSIIYI